MHATATDVHEILAITITTTTITDYRHPQQHPDRTSTRPSAAQAGTGCPPPWLLLRGHLSTSFTDGLVYWRRWTTWVRDGSRNHTMKPLAPVLVNGEYCVVR